jgi:microsomal dipeptidase-like Zn-dependent dipeptidase
MKYVIYVSFPLNIKTMIKDTDDVVRVVGKDHVGAGSDFHMRDVEFQFPTRKERDAAAKRVKDNFPNHEVLSTERRTK